MAMGQRGSDVRLLHDRAIGGKEGDILFFTLMRSDHLCAAAIKMLGSAQRT